MRFLVAAVALASLAGIPGVRAAVDPAVERGVQFLRPRAGGQQVGEAALIALALIKAEATASDPTVSACMAKIRERFAGGAYSPRDGGTRGLRGRRGRDGAGQHRPGIEPCRAGHGGPVPDLAGRRPTGRGTTRIGRRATPRSLSMPCSGSGRRRTPGATVPGRVWDRAARWFLSTQAPAGSWAYHRDEAGSDRHRLDDRRRRGQPPDLPAATATLSARCATPTTRSSSP